MKLRKVATYCPCGKMEPWQGSSPKCYSGPNVLFYHRGQRGNLGTKYNLGGEVGRPSSTLNQFILRLAARRVGWNKATIRTAG